MYDTGIIQQNNNNYNSENKYIEYREHSMCINIMRSLLLFSRIKRIDQILRSQYDILPNAFLETIIDKNSGASESGNRFSN